MRTFEVPAAANVGGLAAVATCDLFQAIGRQDFVSRLLASLGLLAGADYVSIFAFPDREHPVFLGTDSSNSPRLAQCANEHYVNRHYKDDPDLQLLFDKRDAPRTIASYLRRNDIPTASYRMMCYDRAEITDRFSVLTSTDQGQPLRISFYRSIHSGVFADEDVGTLLRFAPVVRAAVVRHLSLMHEASPVVDRESALLRLRERYPALSRREAQVAAGAVAGMTGDEIADWLGIGLTSVITHRKNAYRRLGVDGLRGLILLYYVF